jgi:hypothetical protein
MSELRVIACAAFPREGSSPGHDLVRAFRAGDAAAFVAVRSLLVAGLEREAPDLWVEPRAIVVSMPGHLADSRSPALDRLATALADGQAGWQAGGGVLERVADGPAAKDGRPRDPAAEAATLRWGPVPGTGAVVLLDDVVHTGASLEAARLAAPPEIRERLAAVVAFRAEG